MPESRPQANLIPPNILGYQDVRSRLSLHPDGAAMAAWADMLSMIGEKNSRLHDLLGRQPDPSRSGRTIVFELERERSRIARELHAGAGQPLAGIKLNLEMLDDCAAGLPQAGREALARLQTLAEQALQQVRAVSHKLHPPDWQVLTTADALLSLLQTSGLAARLGVDTDIQPLPVEPSQAVKIALYRCAQECISNILRHSGATRVTLSLRAPEDKIELLLEDNGRGLPADFAGTAEPAKKHSGIGLVAMREHVAGLDGSCDISSGPGGVRVHISLPAGAE